MLQPIFRLPHQKFVGLAKRQHDQTLNHFAFALVNAIPNKGRMFDEGEISEVLTDEALLKERSSFFHVPIEAVVVLASQ